MLTLTLDGRAVDLPEDAAVALSYRVRDLNALDAAASFSETFTLPDTARNHAALGVAHALDSLNNAPYHLLPAVLSENGIPVLEGTGLIEQAGEGYELTLLSQAAALFALIADKQLREVDLSEYDHQYTPDQILNAQDPNGAYTYPLVDDGRFTKRAPVLGTAVVHYTEINPAVFTHTILRALIQDTLPGYELTGSLLNDTTFQRHQLLGGAVGPQRRASYLDAHTLVARTSEDQEIRTVLGGAISLPLTLGAVERDPGHHLVSGTDGGHVYRTLPEVSSYRVQIQGEVTFGGTGGPYAGLQTASLLVVENGLSFHEEVFYNDSWGDQFDPQVRRFRLDFELHRVAGNGPITFELVTGNRMFLRLAAGATVTVTPLARAYDNSPVHLDAGLPDISQADFLLLTLNTFGSMLQVDVARRQVRVDLFNDLEPNRATAVDWTHKVDLSQRPTLRYRLDGLAARNTLAYSSAPGGYADLDEPDYTADGALLVGTDTTLEKEAEAYAAPVAALQVAPSFQRQLSLPYTAQFVQKEGVLLELWRTGITYPTDYFVLDGGRYWQAKKLIDAQYKRPGTDPEFWRLAQEEEVFTLSDATPFAALYTLQPTPVTIRFGAGNATPAQVATAGVTFEGLDFTDLLLDYYPVQQSALQRIRLLEVGVRLSALDIDRLDFTQPVRLDIAHWPGYGPLRGDFALQLIDQYQPGARTATSVQLLWLGDPVASPAYVVPIEPPTPVDDGFPYTFPITFRSNG